jgi:predicted dehydrogenase
MYFEGGILAQFHDAFTVKHAPTGLEVHGTEGSLFAVDVMTQDPQGRILPRRDGEETELKLDPPEDLYAFGVRHFVIALAKVGELIPDHAVVTVSPSSGLGCPDATLRVIGEHFGNYYA